MKRYVSIAMFVFATVFVWSVDVHAQQASDTHDTGLYFGGHFGVNFLSDPDFEQTGSILNANADTGIGLGGVLGYDFGDFRLDGEIVFRHNIISDIVGVTTQGNASALSYMINGYYDLPINGPLKAYIGGGAGFSTTFFDIVTSGIKIADDRDSVLAYQLSGGIGYEVNPRTTVTVGYRYFATGDPEIASLNGFPLRTEYQSHEINIGVRVLFD